MALKKCKECGADISTTARECPKCGKEQRNIITKHPIISTIMLLFLLGIFTYVVTPKQEYKATISRKETSSSSNTIENKVEEENSQISIGDVIKGKDWEISVESAQFSQKVEPPVKNMYYEYYQVKDTSNTYLYMILNCKNISTIDLDASSVATVTLKCNNTYTYTSFSTIPDDTLGFTYIDLVKVKPLTSKKIYYLAEMPKSISEQENAPIELNIEFENKTYKYQYR